MPADPARATLADRPADRPINEAPAYRTRSPASRPAEATGAARRGRAWPWRRLLAAAVLAAAIVFGWWTEQQPPVLPPAAQPILPAAAPVASDARLALCSRAATLDQLRAVLLGQAQRIGGPNPAWLERQMATVPLRVDHLAVQPTGNGTVVCSGLLTMDAAAASAPLVARIAYSVQPGSDARGSVSHLAGAEEVARQLVALEPVEASAPPPTTVEEALPPTPAARVFRKPVLHRRTRPASAPPLPVVEPPAETIVAEPAAPRCSDRPSVAGRMVCADPALAGMDRELTERAAGIEAGGDARAIRRMDKGQAKFLARRDRCEDADCVARLYRHRLAAAAAVSRAAPVAASEASAPQDDGSASDGLPECRGFQVFRPTTPCRPRHR